MSFQNPCHVLNFQKHFVFSLVFICILYIVLIPRTAVYSLKQLVKMDQKRNIYLTYYRVKCKFANQ